MILAARGLFRGSSSYRQALHETRHAAHRFESVRGHATGPDGARPGTQLVCIAASLRHMSGERVLLLQEPWVTTWQVLGR